MIAITAIIRSDHATALEMKKCFSRALLEKISIDPDRPKVILFNKINSLRPPRFDRFQLYSWAKKDYLRNINHVFYAGSQTEPQELLQGAYFNSAERGMFKDLFAQAEKPRNLQRQIIRNPKSKDQLLQDKQVARVVRNLAKRDVKVSSGLIREKMGLPKEIKAEIEFAVIELHLKNGEIIRIKTSSYHSRNIQPVDTYLSISGVLKNKNLDSRMLSGVSYYHNHPASGPLSDGDMNFGHHLLSALRPYSSADLRIDLYAVGRPKGLEEFFVFHTGMTRP